MGLRTTRNNKKLNTNQKNAVKSKNVVTNNKSNNTSNTIKSNFISNNTTNSKPSIEYKSIDGNTSTVNKNVGSIKTNSKPSIEYKSIDGNTSTVNKNVGSIKTNSKPSIEYKSIDGNTSTVNKNVGSIKTNSKPSIEYKSIDGNTSTVNKNIGSIKTNSKPSIEYKSIDRNPGTVNKNVSSIKTSSAKNPHREHKTINRNINSLKPNLGGIKTSINKFAEGKTFKPTTLDNNYQSEIGSNTFLASYNTIVKTKEGIKTTVKTVNKVREIPKHLRRTKNNIKNIPINIRTRVNNIKKTSKGINTSANIIVNSVKAGNFARALKEVPIRRIRNASLKGVSKVFVKGGKISTKLTLKGVKRFGGSFKNSAIRSKTDEASDLGSNTIFAAVDTIKETIRAGTKGVKTINGLYKRIKTAKSWYLKNTKVGTIKTKIAKGKIATNIKYYFNRFKSSKVSAKAIKAYINKLKNTFRKIVARIVSSAIKNPVVLGVIAIMLVVFLLFSSILNSIVGFHGSYFITIENKNQWVTTMNKLDNDMKTRISEHSDVNTIRNSGTNADWKDVIIAYYMKNSNSTDINSGSTTSLGGGTTSVDPKAWENIYKELKSYLGRAYVWGGSNPTTGFDCSGLVQYCYGKYGIPLPRVTTEQVFSGVHVEFGSMQAGDLVFFGTSDNVHHVGVYIGNGKYLQAPKTGDVVKISNLSDRGDFYEARRVFKATKDTSTTKDTPTTKDADTKAKVLYIALPNNKAFVDIFYKVEKETGVDAILLASIAITESSLNPNDVSSAGASGLCQMMPEGFIELGFDISKIFDPYTNVLACAYEIKNLYTYKQITSVAGMLSAYNGGIGNFIKYNGNIPFAETKAYPGKVTGAYSQLSNGQQPSTMEGGSSVTGVNTKLLEVYNCFVKFYKDENSKNTWILQRYTVEEALDNLKFTKEEKEDFYDFKDYNEKFDETEQFGDSDINFKFNF
ncbi:NlpC/P60 family protein [Clostridium estertheticum]|uniref:NlpC/P60 family protein n=2 Tax=Clostridium estertheticum TaxID=238834 RepID=UPI002714C896|nr:NlpC/P60 family protein [Clostridium estertheticum]WLC82445.1 C40 family peptidase [Clostridium estertheticum]